MKPLSKVKQAKIDRNNAIIKQFNEMRDSVPGIDKRINIIADDWVIADITIRKMLVAHKIIGINKSSKA